MTLSNALHIIVCDDHRTMREALGAYIAARPEVATVTLAASAEEAVRVARHGADVLVLDLALGEGMDGLDVLEALNNLRVHLPVLVITGEKDLDSVAMAFTMGARGFCPKTASPTRLYEAILTVAAGRPAVPDDAVAPLLAGVRRAQLRARESAAILGRLTPRERDVLRHLAEGLHRTAIADRMGVSSNTVRTHLRHVMDKLGVNSQLAAAARGRELFAATQRRLPQPDPPA